MSLMCATVCFYLETVRVCFYDLKPVCAPTEFVCKPDAETICKPRVTKLWEE